jgi:cyclase
MRRTIFLSALLAVGGWSQIVANYQGQQQPAPVPPIEKIKDNLYIIKGADPNERTTMTGGSTAVFVTERGVVVVDTKSRGYGRGILDQIKTVTEKPVTMIINTHTHGDHSGSNIEFPATVEIIAHENTKAYMSKATCEPVVNCQSFKGENVKFLPKKTFRDKMSLLDGKDRIDLYYFGRGHTGGDTWVVFPTVGVVHAGDMFQRKCMPYIDVNNSGGSALEFGRTLSKAVAGIKNVDTVIPGHFNDLFSWNDFKEYADFYREFLDVVQAGKRSGKSADEVAQSYKPSERFKGYQLDPQFGLGQFESHWVRANARAIYKELEK